MTSEFPVLLKIEWIRLQSPEEFGRLAHQTRTPLISG